MSSTHWKLKAKRSWNAIAKGTELDIVVNNRTGKPTVREISEALIRKYGMKDYSHSGMPADSIFEFLKG